MSTVSLHQQFRSTLSIQCEFKPIVPKKLEKKKHKKKSKMKRMIVGSQKTKVYQNVRLPVQYHFVDDVIDQHEKELLQKGQFDVLKQSSFIPYQQLVQVVDEERLMQAITRIKGIQGQAIDSTSAEQKNESKETKPPQQSGNEPQLLNGGKRDGQQSENSAGYVLNEATNKDLQASSHPNQIDLNGANDQLESVKEGQQQGKQPFVPQSSKGSRIFKPKSAPVQVMHQNVQSLETPAEVLTESRAAAQTEAGDYVLKYSSFNDPDEEFVKVEQSTLKVQQKSLEHIPINQIRVPTAATVINKLAFVKSAPSVTDLPNSAGVPEIAIIGESNVGKSSLLNTLSTFEAARVSKTPGRTQLLNLFMVNDKWFLMDLPGYGYARMSKDQRQRMWDMVSQYLVQRRNLLTTMLLIASTGFTRADRKYIQWFIANGIPFFIVFTKCDLVNPVEFDQNKDEFLGYLLKQYGIEPVHFKCSASDREGMQDLLLYMAQLRRRYNSMRNFRAKRSTAEQGEKMVLPHGTKQNEL